MPVTDSCGHPVSLDRPETWNAPWVLVVDARDMVSLWHVRGGKPVRFACRQAPEGMHGLAASFQSELERFVSERDRSGRKWTRWLEHATGLLETLMADCLAGRTHAVGEMIAGGGWPWWFGDDSGS